MSFAKKHSVNRSLAKEKLTEKEKSVETSETKASKSERPRVWKNHYRIEVGNWQEAIHGERVTYGKMEAQSLGLFGSYSWVKPFASNARWLYSFGGDLALGNIKGQINVGPNPDGLRGQLWYLAGMNGALLYRTSKVSNMGLGLPLYYRIIDWKINPGSELKMQKKSSFTAGLNTFMEIKMMEDNFLRVGITYFHQWNGTMWSIAWQRELN